MIRISPDFETNLNSFSECIVTLLSVVITLKLE